MSSSLCRLKSSVRTLCSPVPSSSSSTARCLATSSRRYSLAAMTMKRAPTETRASTRDTSTVRMDSRVVYVDAEETDEGPGQKLGQRRQHTASGKERRRAGHESSDEKVAQSLARVDYSSMRAPNPMFAEHLNNLFPGLQFPLELARRILTHASHPAAIYGHNAGLSFMGRRVISAYLYLLLSSSPHLRPSDDLEAIVAQSLNTYVLGERIGSKWGLGRVMRWTPTIKADRAKDANFTILKGVGLYKVQGDAVAAVVGGIFEQFGGSAAHRTFHTRVLPHILARKNNAGLPEAFHADVQSACNRFGGMEGPLLVDHPSSPLAQTNTASKDTPEKLKKTLQEAPSLD